MTPLPIGEGERVLREMLATSGLDANSPRSVGETWDVFKAFIAVPFATDGPDSDGVLYEVGTFGFDGPEEFHLHFLRQLELSDEDGEHDHYEHIDCEFRFPVSEETRSFGQFILWWFAGDESPSWADFIAVVENRPEFIALRATAPGNASIRQFEV